MIIEVQNSPFPSEIPSTGSSFITVDGDQLKTKHSDGSIKVYSTGITQEEVRDIVGVMVTDTTTIDLTYDDVNDQITAQVKDNSIDNSKITSGIDASKIGGGTVNNTEFSQLDGVSSNIQTQINGKENVGVANTLLNAHVAASDPHVQYALDSDLTSKIDISQKGVANGVATLDGSVKIPLTQIPSGIDHGGLSGLADDDHPQYLNQTRADARYYTEDESDNRFAPMEHLHSNATQSVSGYMSAADKTKLDNITNPTLLKTTTTLSSTSNTTFTNLTELNVVCTAGKTYRFEIWIMYYTAATTTGIALSMNIPSGNIAAIVSGLVGANGTNAAYHGHIGYSNHPVVLSGTPTTGYYHLAKIEGIYIATANGNMYPQFRSEINGNSITVTSGSLALINEL